MVNPRVGVGLSFGKEKASQYQVSITGIGDKTEVVILDPDGRWITSHEAERLLIGFITLLFRRVRYKNNLYLIKLVNFTGVFSSNLIVFYAWRPVF